MATAPSTPSTPQRRQNPSLPPRRGQIKEQIFGSLIQSLSSAVSKAGEVLGKITRTGSGSGSASTTPTSTTPPASADTSDGYSDHA